MISVAEHGRFIASNKSLPHSNWLVQKLSWLTIRIKGLANRNSMKVGQRVDLITPITDGVETVNIRVTNCRL